MSYSKGKKSETEDRVLYEVDGNIAVITMNRPSKLHALDNEQLEAILLNFDRANRDPEVRSVLLCGNGSTFCSGMDVHSLSIGLNAAPYHSYLEYMRKLNNVVLTIRRMEKPVVAGVNGPALGAGFSLALACDLILAARSAIFQFPQINLGLPVSGGATYFLQESLGQKRAMGLMMEAGKISCDEAVRLGLITKEYDDIGFLEYARVYTKNLAKKPGLALVEIKKLMHRVGSNSLEEQLEEERYAIATCAKTEDHLEGAMAFMQRRTPEFKGK